MSRRFAALIAVLLALAAGGTILVTVADDPAPAPTPTATATPDALPEGAEREAPDGSVGDLSTNLREETGISERDAARNDRFGERLKPRVTARGIAPPCRTDYSGGVWSSRNGVRPTEFVLHFTVSQNRTGWSDVLAIENYFSSVRSASSHFIMDFEGHCLKMVRGSDKAWTQGNANPWAISVEIIATGRETNAQWRASSLIRREILARLVRSVMDAHALPVRRVNPVGCVFPAGWTDHNALECGNAHTDVQPKFPYRIFSRQLRTVR